MAQSSLTRWAVQRTAQPHAKVLVPWPHPLNAKKVGRPKWADLYQQKLCDSIFAGCCHKRTCKSLLRQHVAKHFAELHIANNEEVRCQERPQVLQWVEATMKELMQQTDIHKLGWEHFHSASFEDLLEKAKTEHAEGQLFHGKEGHHVAEVVGAEKDLDVVCDTKVADEEDVTQDNLLVEQSSDEEFAQDQPEEVERRTAMRQAQRLLALRLTYGKPNAKDLAVALSL
eukprot:499755-Amphidinium_carterae.1